MVPDSQIKSSKSNQFRRLGNVKFKEESFLNKMYLNDFLETTALYRGYMKKQFKKRFTQINKSIVSAPFHINMGLKVIINFDINRPFFLNHILKIFGGGSPRPLH